MPGRRRTCCNLPICIVTQADVNATIGTITPIDGSFSGMIQTTADGEFVTGPEITSPLKMMLFGVGCEAYVFQASAANDCNGSEIIFAGFRDATTGRSIRVKIWFDVTSYGASDGWKLKAQIELTDDLGSTSVVAGPWTSTGEIYTSPGAELPTFVSGFVVVDETTRTISFDITTSNFAPASALTIVQLNTQWPSQSPSDEFTFDVGNVRCERDSGGVQHQIICYQTLAELSCWCDDDGIAFGMPRFEATIAGLTDGVSAVLAACGTWTDFYSHLNGTRDADTRLWTPDVGAGGYGLGKCVYNYGTSEACQIIGLGGKEGLYANFANFTIEAVYDGSNTTVTLVLTAQSTYTPLFGNTTASGDCSSHVSVWEKVYAGKLDLRTISSDALTLVSQQNVDCLGSDLGDDSVLDLSGATITISATP